MALDETDDHDDRLEDFLSVTEKFIADYMTKSGVCTTCGLSSLAALLIAKELVDMYDKGTESPAPYLQEIGASALQITSNTLHSRTHH
jgi:hypothetical protein